MSAPDSVDLEGRAVLVLAFDPEVTPPTLENPGTIVWVGSRPPEGMVVDRLPWEALRALRPDARLVQAAPSDAVVSTLRSVSPADILAATRLGIRRFHIYQAPGAVFQSNARGMLLLALQRSAGRRLGSVPHVRGLLEDLLDMRLDPPWATPYDTRRAPGEIVRHRRTHGAPPGRAAGIVHYVGGLGPGGAERQLTYLASASRAQGRNVRVLTAVPLEGPEGHYAAALRAAGVPVASLPQARFARATKWGLPPELARRLESHVAWPMLASLTNALVERRPEVLHCWLDGGNTIGALAGLIAGVPRIVVSVRNVNPTHFAHLYMPWFRPTYRWLSRCPEVVFVSNSHEGARSYAAWLGIRESRFQVIHNGLPLPPRVPSPEERSAERRALGVAQDAFLVVGVFRLSTEKRPHDFLEVLARARARIPGLRAVHVGTGVLEDEVRRRGADLLGDTLRFVGRLEDPGRWLRVADVCLLTSEQEGCPNVSLEAQALGVPMVLTRAGGAAETVDEDRSGFVVEVGDIEAIVARLALLAGDPGRRAAMGGRARTFVAERFSLRVMVERSVATYSASVKPS